MAYESPFCQETERGKGRCVLYKHDPGFEHSFQPLSSNSVRNITRQEAQDKLMDPIDEALEETPTESEEPAVAEKKVEDESAPQGPGDADTRVTNDTETNTAVVEHQDDKPVTS